MIHLLNPDLQISFAYALKEARKCQKAFYSKKSGIGIFNMMEEKGTMKLKRAIKKHGYPDIPNVGQ